jgi:hypothetical protein
VPGRIPGTSGLTLVVERTSWTDERLDDAIARIEQRFDAVDRRFDAVDQRFERVDDGFNRVWAEFAAVRSEIGATNRLIAQIGGGLVGVFLAQTIAVIVGVIVFS